MPSLKSTKSLLYRRYDARTRRDRVQRQNDSWLRQLPGLVKAYLTFQSEGPAEIETPEEHDQWKLTVITMEQQFTLVLPKSSENAQDSGANGILLSQGYLGATPQYPQLAFSLQVLEIFRQLHRVCPRLSVDGFTRGLQNLHRVSNTDPLVYPRF